MNRRLAVSVSVLALAVGLAACGKDSSKDKNTNGTTTGTATVASKLVFGGPAQFKTRNDGIPGLKKTYGIEFKSVQSMADVGGPITVGALKNGQVDAVDLFTTDPAIKANNFVILLDNKHNFGAQNIVPIVTKAKVTPALTQVLNATSAQITTSVLQDLRTDVETNKKDPDTVAKAWVAANVHMTGTDLAGVKLTVGTAGFPENVVLGYVYAEALKANGATIKVKDNIGERPKYYPALKSGEVNLIPEYTGSILAYLDKKATAFSPDDVFAALKKALPSNLEAEAFAPGQDSDAVVVTKATADKYNLSTIEDLAKKQ